MGKLHWQLKPISWYSYLDLKVVQIVFISSFKVGIIFVSEELRSSVEQSFTSHVDKVCLGILIGQSNPLRIERLVEP